MTKYADNTTSSCSGKNEEEVIGKLGEDGADILRFMGTIVSQQRSR